MIGILFALVLSVMQERVPMQSLLGLLDDAEAAAAFDYPSLGDAEHVSQLSVAIQAEVERRTAGARCVTPAEQAVLTGLITVIEAPSTEEWRGDRDTATGLMERWQSLMQAVLAEEETGIEALDLIRTQVRQARNAPTPRLTELHQRAVRDQLWRRGYLDGPDGWAGAVTPGAMQRVNRAIAGAGCRTDMDNAVWLKTDLAAHGWYRISEHGEEADRAAWLIVQHADRDPAFQAQVLAMLEPLVETGETAPHRFAYLHDRVAVNAGRQQRYGTQGRCTARNVWTPRPMEDEASVEALREQVQIGPLDDYRTHMSRFCAHYDS